MRYSFVVFILVICILSCDKKKIFDGPNNYSDDFEWVNNYDELLIPQDLHWSFTQITKSENSVSVDSTFSHSGKKCLKFIGGKSEGTSVSKASIAKQSMAFWEGETVRMNAYYFIKDTLKLDWLFLMDLEEQTPIGAGPGMRLALVDNQLRVEYKFNEDDLIQNVTSTPLDFPRNKWVELIWEVTLSRKFKGPKKYRHVGAVKLWQDGNLIIDRTDITTLPTDVLYFQQGTKGMYSSCEIGVTANSKDNKAVIYVDDVTFQKVN